VPDNGRDEGAFLGIGDKWQYLSHRRADEPTSLGPGWQTW
jgi:hypothetical protein